MSQNTPKDLALTERSMMERAIGQARKSAEAGEVPVGAVLVSATGEVLAEAGNSTICAHDPAGHAEINVLRAAAQKRGNHRLGDTTLYVTLEPCAMCAGAISHARIARLVYAASDPKGGAVESGVKFFDQATCHHRPLVEKGPLAEEASQLLRNFFKSRRKKTRPSNTSRSTP